LTRVFARLKGLRLDEREPVRIGGWAMRGLLNLPVKWEACQSSADVAVGRSRLHMRKPGKYAGRTQIYTLGYESRILS
jgi:hypothetical protein